MRSPIRTRASRKESLQSFSTRRIEVDIAPFEPGALPARQTRFASPAVLAGEPPASTITILTTAMSGRPHGSTVGFQPLLSFRTGRFLGIPIDLETAYVVSAFDPGLPAHVGLLLPRS